MNSCKLNKTYSALGRISNGLKTCIFNKTELPKNLNSMYITWYSNEKTANLFHWWKKAMMNFGKIVCFYSVLYSKFKGFSGILLTKCYFPWALTSKLTHGLTAAHGYWSKKRFSKNIFSEFINPIVTLLKSNQLNNSSSHQEYILILKVNMKSFLKIACLYEFLSSPIYKLLPWTHQFFFTLLCLFVILSPSLLNSLSPISLVNKDSSFKTQLRQHFPVWSSSSQWLSLFYSG